MADRISIAEIEEIVTLVSTEFADIYDEPIPPFGTHNQAILEGALAAPFQSAGGEDIYPTVYDKAAGLMYFVANDHPFANGNKRISVLACLWYMAKNQLALKISPMTLYKAAIYIVESDRPREELISTLSEQLKKFSLPLNDWLKEVLESIEKNQKKS